MIEINETVSRLCKEKVTLRITSTSVSFINADLIRSNGVFMQISLVNMRLTKIGNTPHVKVEQKSFGVVHEMPVDLIPTRQWKHYAIPNIDGATVAIYLPPLGTIRSLISSLKNMGIKHLLIRGNQSGQLQLSGDVDTAQIGVYFSDLTCSSLNNNNDGNNDLLNDPNKYHAVCVDIRSVNGLMRRIVPDKMAIFSIDQEDASLLYIVGGVVL
ncbi:unnamed protein product [Anisakis simplex]|uniref:Checkpoint protein n=1 Tax=Anisakis simplex TaxID=6269 RepID=A0A0M3K0W4_ANISI|nr:unnamed protein product [Anisakis simplex]